MEASKNVIEHLFKLGGWLYKTTDQANKFSDLSFFALDARSETTLAHSFSTPFNQLFFQIQSHQLQRQDPVHPGSRWSPPRTRGPPSTATSPTSTGPTPMTTQSPSWTTSTQRTERTNPWMRTDSWATRTWPGTTTAIRSPPESSKSASQNHSTLVEFLLANQIPISRYPFHQQQRQRRRHSSRQQRQDQTRLQHQRLQSTFKSWSILLNIVLQHRREEFSGIGQER